MCLSYAKLIVITWNVSVVINHYAYEDKDVVQMTRTILVLVGLDWLAKNTGTHKL